MRRMGLLVAIAVVGLATSILLSLGMSGASVVVTERVSVDSDGGQGNGDSFGQSISADGRFVAFGSNARNLVAGDTNSTRDVFVRDRQTGTTERVSVSSSGGQGDGYSGDIPAISADGRFVAFGSSASNLVAGDTNSTQDVFVRDRQTGTTERVSVSSSGGQGDGPSSDFAIGFAAISADGRFVAFGSHASNLVAGDTNSTRDVFVRDRQTGTTERVSVSSSGGQGDGHSKDIPAISADGRFVAFGSDASNLVAGDTNSTGDVFVRDRQTGTTERVSVDSDGRQGDGGGGFFAAISADGRFVAFGSNARNLVAGDTNGTADTFVHDRQTGTTERVSVSSSGGQGNGPSSDFGSRFAAFSADGRFVAFGSYASNLVAGDTNGKADTFVRDRQTGTTERVSVDSDGRQGDGGGSFAAISADGRFVAFGSYASNLVAGDTNGTADTFVRDRCPGSVCSTPIATTPQAASATFTVRKDFSDNSSTTVNITLSCAGGATANSPKNATENSPAVFTVTGIPPGGTSCTADEVPVPAGYTQSSNCANISVAPDGSPSCTITNTRNDITFTVNKLWSDAPNASGVSVTVTCSPPAVAVEGAQTVTTASPKTWSIHGYTSGTTCTAKENPIPAGYTGSGSPAGTCTAGVPQPGSCTITNTKVPATPVPKRAVLFINGIASSGNCDSPLAPPPNPKAAGWKWISDVLKDEANMADTDFLEYIYADKEDAAMACSKGGSGEYDGGDSCWSLDDKPTRPLLPYQLNPQAQAAKIAKVVHDYLGSHVGVELTIITHSQGGVLATYALTNYAGQYPNLSKVKNLVTLDSPLQGIPVLSPDVVRTRCPASTWLDGRYDSAFDMSPWSAVIKAINMNPGPASTALFTVDANKGDDLCVTFVCAEFVDEAHSHPKTDWPLYGHIRLDLLNHDAVSNGSGDAVDTRTLTEFITCAVLRTVPPAGCEQHAAEWKKNLKLYPQQTAERMVSIRSNTGVLQSLTMWPGSTVSTTLISPSGRVINEATNATDVSHFVGATFEGFSITNPEVGQWTVRLYGEDVSAGGEATTLTVMEIPNSIADADGDLAWADSDNCPGAANSSQDNADSDSMGDACDSDNDNDGVSNESDNCEFEANSDQADGNTNDIGDACDPELSDFDGDGALDGGDNCILLANADQADEDDDGLGDACDEPTGGTMTPTPTPAPSPSVPPAGLGDVDCDGVVDEDDALILIAYGGGIAAEPTCFSEADVDCDLTVGILDALLILKLRAAIITEFPLCA